MTIEPFDAIIVGAGQAGPPIAERCSQQGLRTAIIERRHFGGTCVNDGCVPTKTWVASARAIHMARRGAEFGFSSGDVRVDMARIKARKDQLVGKSRDGVESWMRKLDHTEVIVGHARFTGPGTLRVGDRTLHAPKIFLNVGARSVRPELPGIDDVATLDNVSILELDTVPDHLAIIGGSYIGLEFAQMMRRFGAQVTVIEQSDRLLPREDRDIADAICEILGSEGIRFELGAQCLALKPRDGGVSVDVACGDAARPIEASHVLLAVGRRPNTDDLGLDRAGITVDDKGHITVDDECRTSADGVWAIGECNGRGAFTHTAYNDYEIVAANLFDDDPRRLSDRIPCYALFIDPPLGRVGLSESQARDSGKKLLGATLPMQAVGRAREMSETQGLMKVLVDADTRQILGASILGINGDEVVHGLLDVMNAGQPYTAISRAMHIHPTVSELVPTLLQKLKPLD